MVVLAAICGMAWWEYPTPRTATYLWPLLASTFLAFHCLSMLQAIRLDSPEMVVVLLLVPLLTTPLGWSSPEDDQSSVRTLALLVVIYMTIVVGVYRSLREDFQKRSDSRDDSSVRARDELARGERVGWIFAAIGPHVRVTSISPAWASVLSTVAAWWVTALVGMITDSWAWGWPDVAKVIAQPTWQNPGRVFWTVFFGILAVGRLYTYANGHLPPISLGGRLRTGRLLIPRYDVVLAAPLAIVVFGIWGPAALAAAGLPDPLLLPVSTFTVVFICLGAGPKLQDWRMTAPARLVKPARMNTSSSRETRSNDVVIRIKWG
jgi:hypothetical protein